MNILSLIIFIIFPINSWAYPQFIGFGYTSCLNCHYNPFGNGALTDYGRSVSASIADRLLISEKTSEEELANNSTFTTYPFTQKWFRPSLDYRGMRLTRDYNGQKEKTEFIHMQADANVTIKFGEQDKYIASFTYGYVPKPLNKQAPAEKNYRSREHYLGYRPHPNLGLYAGLMDKVFGLRIPDHNTFSRSQNNLAQNDQSHGATLHYGNAKLDFGLNYFVGNLDQEESVRQKGFSSLFEYTFFKLWRPGASYLKSSSKFLEIELVALHQRLGVGKGSSIMLEIGQNKKTSVITKKVTESRYSMLQNHLKLSRGFFFLNTFEYFKADINRKDYLLRLGPGLQYLPWQRFELRVDLYNSRSFNQNSASDDVWDLAGQVHLWF